MENNETNRLNAQEKQKLFAALAALYALPFGKL